MSEKIKEKIKIIKDNLDSDERIKRFVEILDSVVSGVAIGSRPFKTKSLSLEDLEEKD